MVNNNKHIDFSMLELFKIELDNNTHILEKGLIDLENQGSNTDVESLMRAAHSLKGAARIVGLQKAVELSHSMEDLLEKALKKNYHLNNTDIENLLEGNDIFLDLLKYDYTEIPEQIDIKQNNIDSIIEKLNHSMTYHDNNKTQVNGKPKTKPIINKEDVANLKIEKSDTIMIELFVKELNSDLQELEKFYNLYIDSQNTDHLNNMLQSVHALKGASRIIKMEPLNILNTKLEECLIKFIDKNEFINFDISYILQLYQNALNQDIDTIYDYFYSKYQEIQQFINDFCNESQIEQKLGNTINNLNKIETDSPNQITTNNQNIRIDQTSKTNNDTSNSNQTRKLTDERFVRVYSESINKILGLSGEVLVQTRLIRPFILELQKIKREFLEINTIKEDIFLRLFDYEIDEEIKSKFNESSILLDKILSMLLSHIQSFDNFSRRLEITTDKLYNESVSTRMKPFSEGLSGFPRMVREQSKKLNKKVELIIKGENTKVDRDILEKLESPLNHLVSNAIDHAIEAPEIRLRNGKTEIGRIILEAKHTAGMLMISVSDDGGGINKDVLRQKIIQRNRITPDVVAKYTDNELYDFLFLPGFSTREETTELSGRGVGLDIVANAISEIGGLLKVNSQLAIGTTFTMQLPLTLSVIRSLLVEIAGQTYAFPISRIERALIIYKHSIYSVENSEYIIYENMNIGIINARQIFGFNYEQEDIYSYNIIIISDRLSRYGVVVDKFIGQPDLVLLKLDKKLGRIPNISNGAILEDGSPTLVIDVDDMVRSIESILKYGKVDKIAGQEKVVKENKVKKILIVEDSLTVREVERKLLENKGYNVTVAVDGIDGWNVLHRGEEFDLIISDIDMPRMNGIELVKKIRTEENFRDIPIMIVSYKDREEDKLKGLEAGANYYLTKSSFHDDTLIDAVEDLIGAV